MISDFIVVGGSLFQIISMKCIGVFKNCKTYFTNTAQGDTHKASQQTNFSDFLHQ